MNFLYLLASILGESGGYTFDKLNFKRNRIGFRHLMFLTFSGMAICFAAFIFLTKQTFPHFSLLSLGLITLIVIFSFGSNVFDYLSLKVDDLSLREPLINFSPILAGLVGYVFFPAERKPSVLLAFIAGAFVIHWGMHKIKLGKVQKKGIGYLLLAITLYAFMPSLYRETLDYLSPAYLTFFRVAGTLLLVSLFLPFKSIRGFTPKRVWYGMVSSVFCSIGAIAGLYAIQTYGVVFTMLFMMLGPALRYIAGYFLLHEKIRKSEIISSLMLTLVVAITAFTQ